MSEMRFFAQIIDYDSTVLLFGKDNQHALHSIQTRPIEHGVEPEPIRISMEIAQSLIDALSRAGLRPNQGTENVSDLKEHIGDLREICFKLIDKGVAK